MCVLVQTETKLLRIKAKLLGQPDSAVTAIEMAEALRWQGLGLRHVGLVEEPERTLVGGAFRGLRDELARCPMLEDVHELDPREPGAHNLFDDLRLSLSREMLAARSKEIAVVDNQHRRIRMAEDVAILQDAGQVALLDRRRVDPYQRACLGRAAAVMQLSRIR